MTKKQKRMLWRIVAAALMTLALAFFDTGKILGLVLHLIPYAVIGYDIILKAARGIFNRQIFDENFLMAVATLGAFVLGFIGEGDYTEAVAVMLFYQIGELFQSVAVGKSRKSISALMDIRPDTANVELDGEVSEVSADEVEIGSVTVVRPGERVAIDGVIIDGFSSIDTSALSGESVPRSVRVGDTVLSGSINMTGLLKIKTTKDFGESTASKILDLVENASARKSRSEAFISRFARVYTPTVCIAALALALLPPAVNAIILQGEANFGVWVYRALSFLVASCPCALVISIPLSFFGGIGGASREGILIKGSNYLEALAKTKTVVFDKTGTLTRGTFDVTEINAASIDPEDLIEYAALAECASTHPIAASLVRAYGSTPDRSRIGAITEKSGLGIVATVDGKEIAVGNGRLLDSLGIAYTEVERTGTVVYVAIDGVCAGYAVISDAIKPEAKSAIESLSAANGCKTVMLSGDHPSIARAVAKELSIDEAHGGLLPADKVDLVERLLSEKPRGSTLVFVGDGINDAPVLSRADVGIAMGAIGSDAAIEAADVVLMDDDPRKLSRAIRIAKKCIGIVYTNIAFAIAVKILALVLVAFGAVGMWMAIFADAGVMILAVLNAMRCLKNK